MNEMIMTTLCVIGVISVIMCPIIVSKVIKYKLEVEKMRLEAEVKKEGIRAKNQFEFDKMIAEEQAKLIEKKQTYGKSSRPDEDNEKTSNAKAGKERVRY